MNKIIITQIAKGKKEIKLGSLSPTRDFNFVEDTCAAFYEVGISNNTEGKVINAASNFEISINNLSSKFIWSSKVILSLE